jgi:hypothetical protein
MLSRSFGLGRMRNYCYFSGLSFGRNHSYGLSRMFNRRFSFSLSFGAGGSFRYRLGYCFRSRRSLCRGFDMRSFSMCGLEYRLG